MQTLLSKLNSLPPYKVRLHARHKRGRYPIPMTAEEIATSAGLTTPLVQRISRLRSWNTVRVETMLRFCAACGVELLRQWDHKKDEQRTNGFKNATHLRATDEHLHLAKYLAALRDGDSEWRQPLSMSPPSRFGRKRNPLSLEQRAIAAGLSPNTVRGRIERGWTEAKALTTPRGSLKWDGQKQWRANNIAT